MGGTSSASPGRTGFLRVRLGSGWQKLRRDFAIFGMLTWLGVQPFAEEVKPGRTELLSDKTARAFTLNGVVTCYSSEWPILFVQEGSRGVYLKTTANLGLKPGDYVTVVGQIGEDGLYEPTRITTDRSGLALPDPVVAGYPELMSASLDSRWVQTEGTLRSIRDIRGHLELTLYVDEAWHFRVMLPRSADSERLVGTWLDARLRVHGVCSGQFDANGVIVGFLLWSPGTEQIDVVGGALDPFERAETSIADFRQSGRTPQRWNRAKIAGRVTGVRDDEHFYLQDRTGGILVRTKNTARRTIGDSLEAVGMLAEGEHSMFVDAAVVRNSREPVSAVPVPPRRSASELLDGRNDAELVVVHGELLKLLRVRGEVHLILMDDDTVFTAVLRAANEALASLRPGSRVAVTGVCTREFNPDRSPWLLRVLGRTPADVVVLAGPPWMTLPRGLGLLAALLWLSLVAVSVFWRRQVVARERYGRLVENAQVMIFSLDRSGRVTSWNRAAENLSGRRRESVLGRVLGEFVAANDVADLSQRLSGTVGRPVDFVVQMGLPTLRKGVRRVEISFRFESEAGTSGGWECVGRDVTQRHADQEFLVGQKRALERAARGEPLSETLAEIIRMLEVQSKELRCCVMLFDSEQGVLRCGAAPSLPAEFRTMADGMAATAEASVCGAAVARRDLVMVADALKPGAPPACEGVAKFLEARGVWSLPILARDGSVLGTFGCFCREAGAPGQDHLDRLRHAAALASVVIERARQDEAATATATRLRRAGEDLVRLACSPGVSNGVMTDALREITETAGNGLAVARASVWFVESEKALLWCADVYDRNLGRHAAGEVLSLDRYLAYAQAVGDARYLAVVDVQTDPRTSVLAAEYWVPHGIVSTLEAPVRVDGRMVGVVCLEQTGRIRVWSDDDGIFVASLADVTAQAWQAQRQRSAAAALRASELATLQTEQSYREAILASGAVPYRKDLRTKRYSFMGEGIQALTGYEVAEMTPTLWEQIVVERVVLGEGAGLDDQEAMQRADAGQLRLWRCDALITTKSGERRWVSDSSTQLLGADGKSTGSVGLLLDITDRKQAEATIRASEAAARETERVYRQAIAAGGAVPYCFNRSRFCYTYMGEGILALTGYSVAEVTPELWDRIIKRRIMTGRLSGLDEAAARKAAAADPHGLWNCDLQIRTKGGEDRWLSDASIKVRGTDGVAPGCIGILQDVTHWYRTREELSLLNARLEERVLERTAALEVANRELTDFAHAVSHDLKAPLRGVNNLAEWILKDHGAQLGAEGTNLFGMLQQRVGHMLRLVDGLLEYARAGQGHLSDSQVNLDELVNELVELLAPPPEVRIEIPAPLPVVRGNPDRWRQIFQNLLDNALKYLDQPEGRIVITAVRKEDEWEFAVSDTGPGIPPPHRERIFQIFQRVPGTKVQGSGVGLALVKRIVEANGGTITVESEVGHGSIFKFNWPDRVPLNRARPAGNTR